VSGDIRLIREQLIEALRELMNSKALKTELLDSLEGDILGIKLKAIVNNLIENQISGATDPEKLILALKVLEEHSLIKNNKLTQFKIALHQIVKQYTNSLLETNVTQGISAHNQQWPVSWGTIGNYFEIRSLPPKPTREQIQRQQELTELQKAEKVRLMHLRAALGTVGREQLMQGVDLLKPVSPTTARNDYLNFLAKRMHELTRVPTNSQHITMEELLTPEGKDLYLAALEEETNSREFREAVLLASTKHFPGKAWNQPKVIIGAGSTGAGKSYARDQVVLSVSEEKDHDAHPGNNVVSIDGGVERETSQIRMLTLQVALSRGYDGVDDLQEISEKIGIKVKSCIKKTVLASNEINKQQNKALLSLYVPVTFANPFEKAHHLFSDPDYDPLFVLVHTDEMQNKIMLRDRAFRTDPVPYPESEIRLGGIVDKVEPKCESKEPKPGNVPRGNEKSEDQMKDAHRKGVTCKIADNDLVQLKRVGYGWEICNDYKLDRVDLKMLRRDFERWNALDPMVKQANPLENWSKQAANRSPYRIVTYNGGPIDDYLLYPKIPGRKLTRAATLAKSMIHSPTANTRPNLTMSMPERAPDKEQDPRLTKSDDHESTPAPQMVNELRQNPLFIRSGTLANVKAKRTLPNLPEPPTKPAHTKKLPK